MLTNEQRDKILEFCGFKYSPSRCWYSPEGKLCSGMPPIDLNFFGKWVLVKPEIKSIHIYKTIENKRIVTIYTTEYRKYESDELPLDEDALISALLKLISENKGEE